MRCALRLRPTLGTVTQSESPGPAVVQWSWLPVSTPHVGSGSTGLGAGRLPRKARLLSFHCRFPWLEGILKGKTKPVSTQETSSREAPQHSSGPRVCLERKPHFLFVLITLCPWKLLEEAVASPSSHLTARSLFLATCPGTWCCSLLVQVPTRCCGSAPTSGTSSADLQSEGMCTAPSYPGASAESGDETGRA